MKLGYTAALWAFLVLQSGGDTPAPHLTSAPPVTPALTRAPQSWLGLRVAKPDETITAQVPSLPQGIGFIVKFVNEHGPAHQAGLIENDLLWKIGDQMLVNEAQLATLLRLSKPGEKVIITGFRAGKPLEVKLTLGEAPVRPKSFTAEMIESSIMPGVCPGPMRLVNVADKTATFSTEDGRAEVRKDGEIYQIKIESLKNEVIFEGEIPADDQLETIPKDWRRRVQVLCRTLDQALDGAIVPQRQPRPRVVPPPGENL